MTFGNGSSTVSGAGESPKIAWRPAKPGSSGLRHGRRRIDTPQPFARSWWIDGAFPEGTKP